MSTTIAYRAASWPGSGPAARAAAAAAAPVAPELPPAALAGPALLAALVESLDKLPAQRPVAARVLQLAQSDDSSAGDVGQAVAADPTLTARLMRLANSAYYGLSGRIRTPAAAVTVIGFTTTASLALAAAAGVDDDGAVPEGFWAVSAATAIAAAETAGRFGVQAPDAFCLGLLARLGQALLFQADPVYRDLTSAAHRRCALLDAEQDRYQATHTQVSAQALGAWSFPGEMVRALEVVDRPGEVLPWALCLRVAFELAERHTDPDHEPDNLQRLSGGRLADADAGRVLAAVAAGTAELAAAITS